MRWSFKSDEIAEVKITKKFLFFPKCIAGEWRWLEKVSFTSYNYDKTSHYQNWNNTKIK